MRTVRELKQAIEKEEKIMNSAASGQTRGYARERRSYLLGELMLQREWERKQAEGKQQ